MNDTERLAQAIQGVLNKRTLPVNEAWLAKFSQETASAQYLEVLGFGTRWQTSPRVHHAQ